MGGGKHCIGGRGPCSNPWPNGFGPFKFDPKEFGGGPCPN